MISLQFNLTLAVVRFCLFSCQWKPVALQLWNFLTRVSLELEWCLCLQACHPLLVSYDQKVILCIVSLCFKHNYLVFRAKLDQFGFIRPPHVSSLRWILAILPSAKQSAKKNLGVFYFWVFQSSVGGTFNGDRISFGDNKLLLSCMLLLCSQVNSNGVHFTEHLTHTAL